MHRAAVITVSDSRFIAQREDTGGPLVCQLLTEAGYEACLAALVPDEQEAIEAALCRCADQEGYPLILTTGGTGLAPRDVTPEATLAVCHRLVPGICEAMRWNSLAITPHAMLSRMVAGTRGQSLIINLPGSPKAIRENLAVVLPALSHGLEVLTGQGSQCGKDSLHV